MGEGVPAHIPIARDDHHARFVGTTADGRQFFVTTPFCPGGHDFIARYLFDADGRLVDDLGPRRDAVLPGNIKRHEAAERDLLAKRVAELGDVTFESIRVRPFQVERFGQVFGLVVQEPEQDDEDAWVTVEPGDYMAFYPPWDGDYDT